MVGRQPDGAPEEGHADRNRAFEAGCCGYPGLPLYCRCTTRQPARHHAAHRRSHLFTVRLWSEAMGDDRVEWRGQVRYVTSGETHYFRDWSTLVALFLEMVSADQSCEAEASPPRARKTSEG